MSIDKRLRDLGIVLPSPAAPAANYVPYVIAGDLLTISGQVCMQADGTFAPAHQGKLGGTVSLEEGRAAARLCAINLLAQARAALGDLERIHRCLRLGGFINATPDFTTPHLVMNGASDLIVEVLGERGRHARSTVGVATLPFGCAVEVEALFQIV